MCTELFGEVNHAWLYNYSREFKPYNFITPTVFWTEEKSLRRQWKETWQSETVDRKKTVHKSHKMQRSCSTFRKKKKVKSTNSANASLFLKIDKDHQCGIVTMTPLYSFLKYLLWRFYPQVTWHAFSANTSSLDAILSTCYC